MSYVMMVLGWLAKGLTWASFLYNWVVGFFVKHGPATDAVMNILNSTTMTAQEKTKAIAVLVLMEVTKTVTSSEPVAAATVVFEDIEKQVSEIITSSMSTEDKHKAINHLMGK